MPGYSGTPLEKKLGLKPGFRIRLINPPSNYFSFFNDWPEDVQETQVESELDFIHLFVKEKKDLDLLIPELRKQIKPNGMIWVSWPKKASRVETDVTEDIIRAAALANKLVDVKVCAVDSVWSGLKLMIRIKDR